MACLRAGWLHCGSLGLCRRRTSQAGGTCPYRRSYLHIRTPTCIQCIHASSILGFLGACIHTCVWLSWLMLSTSINYRIRSPISDSLACVTCVQTCLPLITCMVAATFKCLCLFSSALQLCIEQILRKVPGKCSANVVLRQDMRI
jgi:hypothetical protein